MLERIRAWQRRSGLARHASAEEVLAAGAGCLWLELARGRSWRQALRAGPRNPIVHVNLASLLCRTDRRDEAIPLYLRATELAPGLGPAWRGLGQAYLEQGQPDEARRTLLRALELDPGDRSARVLLERLEGREAPEQP